MDLNKAKSILGVEFSFHADFVYQIVKELGLEKTPKPRGRPKKMRNVKQNEMGERKSDSPLF